MDDFFMHNALNFWEVISKMRWKGPSIVLNEIAHKVIFIKIVAIEESNEWGSTPSILPELY